MTATIKDTLLIIITSVALLGQTPTPPQHPDPASLPTGNLLSEAGPAFRIGDDQLGSPPRECLENWWQAFPELHDRRWYSVQLGSRVYVFVLDSDASLLPDSDQTRWLKQQVSLLPTSIDFVILCLHHPPVADIQTHFEVNHNPRSNEVALRDNLSTIASQVHARFIVPLCRKI